MCGASALAPADELLGQVPEGDDRELPVKPLGTEQQEQVDAENDGQRPEAELELVASGPRQQAAEREGENELGEDQRVEQADTRHVIAPVGIEHELCAGLHVVRLPRNDTQRQRPPSASRPHEQRSGPDEQHAGCSYHRARDRRLWAQDA